MFGPRKLGTRITIGVSTILALILLGGAGVLIFNEYSYLQEKIRREADRTLTVLEAVHTQAMLWRGDPRDGNPVIEALNGTFDQLSVTSKNMTLWLVMGTKVLDYQRSHQLIEYEPPKDEIDREAIATAMPVVRMVEGNVFRLTRPVILGRGTADNQKCFDCHGKLMGIKEGEVIGAFSIALSTASDREQFDATMRGALLITILASLVIAGVCAVLVKKLASDPISGMTRIMTRLAQGDVDVDIPSRDRSDEIGEMARAVKVFKEHAVAIRTHEAELAKVSRRTTMGELASALAHELAQPLAAINTYCTGLLRRIRSGDWTKDDLIEVLQEASKMTQRAREIIHGIATHVRGEESDKAQNAIDDVIRGIKPMLEADARSHGVRLIFKLGNGTRTITINKTEIENVILNLARNGIDAMQDTASNQRELTIWTSAAKDDGTEISIVDTGKGMPLEVRDQAFKPFYSTKPGGMGIGLSICRSTIEAHGGRLWLTPNTGGGTIARFVLPPDGSDHANLG